MPRPNLTRDALLSLAGIGLVGGSAAVYSVAVGRLLGPGALGQAGVALAVGLGAAQLAMAGLAPAITRFTAAHRAAGRAGAARRLWADGLVAAVAIGAALALGIALTGGWWAPLVGLQPNLVVPTAWLVALQSIYIGLKAAMYGVGAIRAYAAAEGVAAVAFGIALLAVLSGAGVSLVAPFLAANAAFAALTPVVLPGRAFPSSTDPAPPVAPLLVRDLGVPRFVLIATLGSAAAIARLQLPLLITGAYWPADEVGLLAAALAFLPPVLLLPRALELALLPALAGAWGRGDRGLFRELTRRALRRSGLALTALTAGLLVLGPPLLGWLYGPEYAAAATALRAVLVSAWALGIAVPAVVALSASDGVAIPNAAGVAGLVVSLIAWAAWVPDHGATGAALGLAAGSLVNAGLPLAAMARRLAG